MTRLEVVFQSFNTFSLVLKQQGEMSQGPSPFSVGDGMRVCNIQLLQYTKVFHSKVDNTLLSLLKLFWLVKMSFKLTTIILTDGIIQTGSKKY